MDVVEHAPGRHLVLGGHLDARSAPDLRQALHRAVDEGAGDLFVDVADLVIVHVPAVALLLEAHRRGDRRGRRVLWVDVPPPTVRLLRVTRLLRVLVLAESSQLQVGGAYAS